MWLEKTTLIINWTFFLGFKFWFFFTMQLRVTILDLCISLNSVQIFLFCWDLWICAIFCYAIAMDNVPNCSTYRYSKTSFTTTIHDSAAHITINISLIFTDVGVIIIQFIEKLMWDFNFCFLIFRLKAQILGAALSFMVIAIVWTVPI